MNYDVMVLLTDGTSRKYPRINESHWYCGRIEGDGCLTVYRQWDGGVCAGQDPVASFAPGRWVEWHRVDA
jgi:hypothetical protein